MDWLSPVSSLTRLMRRRTASGSLTTSCPHTFATPNVQAHRGQIDTQVRYWFEEYRGNRAAMFDTRSEKFQEWRLPAPYTFPYTSSSTDENGRVYLSTNMGGAAAAARSQDERDHRLSRPDELRFEEDSLRPDDPADDDLDEQQADRPAAARRTARLKVKSQK